MVSILFEGGVSKHSQRGEQGGKLEGEETLDEIVGGAPLDISGKITNHKDKAEEKEQNGKYGFQRALLYQITQGDKRKGQGAENLHQIRQCVMTDIVRAREVA